MSAYWGPGVADYRVRATSARLEVSQGTTGRRIVSLLLIVMGALMLALVLDVLERDEPMSTTVRVIAVVAGVGLMVIGLWMMRRAGPVAAVFERRGERVVIRGGDATSPTALQRRLADFVEPVIEDREFTDGDIGHRLILVFRSGERVPLGQDFVGGQSANRAVAAIRRFQAQSVG